MTVGNKHKAVGYIHDNNTQLQKPRKTIAAMSSMCMRRSIISFPHDPRRLAMAEGALSCEFRSKEYI